VVWPASFVLFFVGGWRLAAAAGAAARSLERGVELRLRWLERGKSTRGV
jgi:hypothetical protein